MPPAWSTSTATRRPWETTSLKKFIVLGQVYFISVSNTQSIIIFRKVSQNYCIRVVHALGVARTLYAAPRGAVKHVVTVRRRSSSYATMFQTEAQQATPECQQSVLVKREVIRRMQGQENIMVVLPLSGEASSVHAIPSLWFVSLTCGAASCMWRVISNSTRPTARHSRYHQRQIDGPVMDGP